MLSVLTGLIGFCAALWFVLNNKSSEFSGFYEPAAFVLLLVAPISVTFMSHNFKDFFAGLKTLFSLAMLNQKKDMGHIINQLTELSLAVRNEGMGILASYKNKAKGDLFKVGLTLILNNFTTDEIKHNLTAKINARQTQYAQASSLFEYLGKLCPGMGMLGTIIGLVQMLSNMNDPSKIGPGMAVALLTTLYGLILGTVVYTPISEKITIYAEKTLQQDMMVMEGIILLKDKKSNAHVRDVVSTYGSQGKSKAPGKSRAPMSRAPRSQAPMSQAPQSRRMG